MTDNKCVVILTAGKGSRLNERTKFFNKALLRVGDKAVISHTIDAFSNDTEFVIVLGYKADMVKQYLQIAHPEKKFTFVETEKYSESGAGPGYALRQCRDFLQRPFYYVSCDSIINWFPSSYVQGSWAGVSKIPIEQTERYCTVKISDLYEKILGFYDKDPKGTNLAFNGVAYIENWEEFWTKMDAETETVNGEIQAAGCILSLLGIVPVQLEWFDTGEEEGLQKARQHFKGIENLDKLDEELYVVNNVVVKYFHNANMVTHRAQRTKSLNNTTPELLAVSKNFYKYQFVEGEDLFKLERPQEIAKSLFDFTQEKIWSHKQELSELDTTLFRDVCKRFYYDKTISRLNHLYKKLGITDGPVTINGKRVPSIERLFQRINWDFLSKGTAAKFHGDYNFSNILYTKDNSFVFLDWRQDFGGSIEYGDIYYDFAKMYHSFLFPHPAVKKEKYFINILGKDNIKLFIEVSCELALCKGIFEEFLLDNGYDLWKTKILTAIVLLNMAPLHEAPIDKYLYYYARNYLYEVLNEG